MKFMKFLFLLTFLSCNSSYDTVDSVYKILTDSKGSKENFLSNLSKLVYNYHDLEFVYDFSKVEVNLDKYNKDVSFFLIGSYGRNFQTVFYFLKSGQKGYLKKYRPKFELINNLTGELAQILNTTGELDNFPYNYSNFDLLILKDEKGSDHFVIKNTDNKFYLSNEVLKSFQNEKTFIPIKVIKGFKLDNKS